MNKKQGLLFLATLTMLQPSSAFADFERYPYFGAKVGYNLFSGDCFSISTDCDDSSVGYGIFAGYQFNSWLGAEIDAIDYGNYNGKYLNYSLEDDVRGYAMTAKFTKPIQDNIDAYLRAGAVYININRDAGSDSNVSPVAALGIDYKLTPSWTFRPEYQLISDVDGRSSHFVTLGLSYRFINQSTKPALIQIDSSMVKVKPEPFVLKELEQSENDKEILIAAPLLFNTNSSLLTEESMSELKKVADFVKNKPNTKVWLEGYTDNTGSVAYNKWLSDRRANAAGVFLSYLGVENIYMKGKGIASTNVKGKNASDRKVVVSVTQNNEELVDF